MHATTSLFFMFHLLFLGLPIFTGCRTSDESNAAHRVLSQDLRGGDGVLSEDKTDFNKLTDSEKVLLLSIRDKVNSLHQRMAQFWFTTGPDTISGGFFGHHDLDGNPDPKADKGLINQSRHLWYVSNYYQHVEKKREIKAHADSLFRFITTSKLYDASSQEFFFRVNHTGQTVTEERKQFYANSFAIYGLANYGMIFKNNAAKMFALNAYKSIVGRGWDSINGGFNQKKDPWYFSDSKGEKDYNSHLHIMEAMTSLYLATSNPDVKAKLSAFIDLFADKMIGNRFYIPAEFKLDWTPYGEPTVSYGHDLETVWLLLEAARALDLAKTDPVRYQSLVTKLKVMGEYSADKGFDATNGGYYESGKLDGSIKSSLKVWWVQAEAVCGLWQLYRLTGKVKYLYRIDNILDFIEKHLVAPSGEWYWQVEANGAANSAYNFISGEWKASYHNGRSLMNMNKWVNEIL